MNALAEEVAAGTRLARRFVGNTLVQVVAPAVRMSLGVLLTAALGRYLGAEGFGSYALVFAWVATFDGVFNEWGLSAILLREISRHPDRRDELLAGGAALQTILACGTYSVMLAVLAVPGYPGSVNLGIALYGLTLLFAPLNVLSLSFQADLALVKLLPASLVGAGLNFALSLTVVVLKGSFLWLIAAAVVALGAQYVMVTRLCLARLGPHRGPARAHWIPLLREAWPLGVTAILSTAMQQAPILVISWLSLREAGLFGAASKIPQQLYLLPMVLRNSTYPLLAGSWAADREQFAGQLSRLVSGSVLVSAPVIVLGAGLAGPITAGLFGPQFAPAAKPFALLIGVFGLLFPGILLGEAMIAAGFQRQNLAIQSVGAPLMILALLLLVPRHGAAGAALAQLAAYLVIVAATVVAARRRLGRSVPLRALLAGGAGALVGGVVLALAGPLGAVPAALLGALAALATVAILIPDDALGVWSLACLALSRTG